MRKGLRKEILETARRLFAREGYNSVSMRDIAKELDVSVGNVTYYFKKKEDLIEAAVLEKAQNPQMTIAPEDLYQLNELFWELADIQLNNTYYFRHYTQLAQISPQVYEIQQQRILRLTENLKGAFAALRQSGIMEPEDYPCQTEEFVQGLLRISLSWISRSLLREKEDSGQFPRSFVECMWSMIYPALTSRGRTEYLSVLRPANQNRSDETEYE